MRRINRLFPQDIFQFRYDPAYIGGQFIRMNEHVRKQRVEIGAKVFRQLFAITLAKRYEPLFARVSELVERKNYIEIRRQKFGHSVIYADRVIPTRRLCDLMLVGGHAMAQQPHISIDDISFKLLRVRTVVFGFQGG